jgi:hypothetical protein
MFARAAQLVVSVALPLCGVACASAETVVHVSAPHEARWDVLDAEGAQLCSLPCSVELDDHESVSVVRTDGHTRFVVRQEDLGAGAFSASVRVRREETGGTLAARAVAAALSGAGSVLMEAEDKDHVAAGVFLSGIGAAARAASDVAREKREELWVRRTSTP